MSKVQADDFSRKDGKTPSCEKRADTSRNLMPGWPHVAALAIVALVIVVVVLVSDSADAVPAVAGSLVLLLGALGWPVAAVVQRRVMHPSKEMPNALPSRRDSDD